jgi:hypothetical protein
VTGSFLDDLRATGRHILEHAIKDIDVPGRGGLFVVRYGPPERDGKQDTLAPIIAAYRVNGALTAAQEQQFIIDCHQEILRRPKPNAAAESYDPPLRFDGGDDRWGDDVTTARAAVAKLFALKQQPAAAAGHADALMDWLQGLDSEIASRVEGDSERGPDS